MPGPPLQGEEGLRYAALLFHPHRPELVLSAPQPGRSQQEPATGRGDPLSGWEGVFSRPLLSQPPPKPFFLGGGYFHCVLRIKMNKRIFFNSSSGLDFCVPTPGTLQTGAGSKGGTLWGVRGSFTFASNTNDPQYFQQTSPTLTPSPFPFWCAAGDPTVGKERASPGVAEPIPSRPKDPQTGVNSREVFWFCSALTGARGENAKKTSRGNRLPTPQGKALDLQEAGSPLNRCTDRRKVCRVETLPTRVFLTRLRKREAKSVTVRR